MWPGKSVEYIKMDELKNGYLYKILARNASCGIWIEDAKGFLISRTKWGDNFTFVEYHWDTGEPYGTVKPLKEIEKSPFKIGDLEQEAQKSHSKRILKYLNGFSDGEF